MERTTQKIGKRKPQLIIETKQDSVDNNSFKRKSLHRNQVEIKPLMSAKNRHQLKNAFSFPVPEQNASSLKEKQENKIRALQRLQVQKVELMKSLQFLKQGAVSAIVQKQEQIHKLKQQIYVTSISEMKKLQKQEEQRSNNKFYEKQLQLKESYQRELEEEVEELRRELRKQRIRYESELYQKEEMINSLCVQLNDSYQKIDKLQKFDELLTQKIKNVELENLSLLKELETSQIMNTSQNLNKSQQLNSSHQLNSSFFLNLSSVTNKTKNKSLSSEDGFFEQVQTIGDLSYASTIGNKKYSAMLNEEQDNFSNSFISQRIDAIKQRHKEEVKQIKEHYQQEISRLKEMQEKDASEKQSGRNSRKSLQRMSSVESFRSSGSGQRDIQQIKRPSLSKTRSYHNLNKPQLRQFSHQGLPFFQQGMQSITQRGQYDQDLTPRNHFSLKDQILQQQMYPSHNRHINYDNDNITIVSNLHNYFNNKNSSQKSLLNYDTLSQFTANHFEYPFGVIEKNQKVFLKNKSIATFEAETETNTNLARKISSVEDRLSSYQYLDKPDKVIERSPSNVLSMQSSEPITSHAQSEVSDDDDRLSTKSNHSVKSNQSVKSTKSIKKDIMLFCMGLVTGGTLIGVGKRLLNK